MRPGEDGIGYLSIILLISLYLHMLKYYDFGCFGSFY
jgi:hypothetical protein